MQLQPLTKDNFADQAEQVIKSRIKRNKKSGNIELTTSKIRNLLSMANVIYKKACNYEGAELNDDIKRDIQYLKMRFAYEAGREPIVKDFIEKANIMDHIKQIGNSKEKLLVFCNYIEALVAYHRYYGDEK